MPQKKLCISIIAHNQFSLVQQQLKNLVAFTDNNVSVVIVDQSSHDGLTEYLKNQDILDYILCEEIENYAVILNTIIKEFAIETDLFILSAEHFLLPKCIEIMQKILYQHESFGAVYANICGSDTYGNLSEAINLNETNIKSTISIAIPNTSFMLKNDFIKKVGFFDENLIVPENILIDYSFRGALVGYSISCISNQILYQLSDTNDLYKRYQSASLTSDKMILKEKWGMNYFNVQANHPLLSLMESDTEAYIFVLEIGCDCGANLIEVKNRYPNAELYGVEINPNAAEIASNIAKISVQNIEDNDLVFGNIRFDYIIFGDVLEHLRDPENVVKYCKQHLLKKDGRFLASIPNLMHYSVLQRLINGYFTYTDWGLLDKTHIHFFTEKEIVLMFAKSGCSIEKCFYTGGKQLANNQEQMFVNQLLQISDKTEEYMFYAYQYLISAK